MPWYRAVRTTARTQAFMPGASPPLVRTPILLMLIKIPPVGLRFDSMFYFTDYLPNCKAKSDIFSFNIKKFLTVFEGHLVE
jgi:hypothetical protein